MMFHSRNGFGKCLRGDCYSCFVSLTQRYCTGQERTEVRGGSRRLAENNEGYWRLTEIVEV